jgi:PAS domain S-box-containing protein
MTTSSNDHNIKVLLVEDSRTDARLLLHDLKEIQGNAFDVTWVERMDDALAQLGRQSFDVGLLDLSLPDSSGIDTFTRIQEAAPLLPVVVLTGATDEGMGVEAIRHGVQDYLVKGFADGTTVARAIRYAVERKMGEDAIRKLNAELELRVLEIQTSNDALRESQRAALNLMEDALAARRQAEKAIGDLAKISDQRLKALEMRQKLVLRLDLLSHSASDLLQTQEPLALVESLCRKVLEHLDCQAFFNFVVDENAGKLHLNAWAGVPDAEARRIEWLDFGVAVCGCAARDGNRIVAENIPTTPDVRTELVKSYGIKAYACHPIFGKDEKVMGTLSFGTKTRETFSDDDLSLMKAVTDQVAIAMIRMKNEQDLLRSREEWVETFNVIPDHIAILDDKHRIVRANKAMAEKLGLTPEEVIGKPCHLCVHGSKKPIAACPHSLLLKDGRQHIAEVYEDRLGGDFLVSVTPIFGANGAIKGSVHVARDITERKKREDELHKLNRTLEALSKSSQAMTRTSDEHEFLDEVCRIVVEDCGYAMVWIGYAQYDDAKTVLPVAHAGFDDGYLDTLNISWADNELGRGPTGTAIRTGSICQCRNMLTDPAFLPWREEAKKRGYGSSICIPLVMYDKPFGAITIYSREPDAFSESEARLLVELANDLAYGITTIRLRAAQSKAEESLRDEHNFINTILQTTGGLIVGFDLGGRIKIFNHSCERATGYTMSDVKDRVFWDFLLVPEEAPGVKEVFKNLSGSPTQSEYENYWVARDGARRFIRWTNSTVLDKDGKVELVIGTGIDITERKQAEIELERYKTDLERLVMERTAALRASEEQLMKANEMKLLGQLTSGVAHEVRNPLNGIIAIMGALSKELSDTETFKPYVQHMRNQVRRLTVLMEDLLAIGRPIQKEKMADIPFAKVVRSAVSSWQQGLQGQREVQFTAPDTRDQRVTIFADEARIEQMVVNLLDNAHQHTPADKLIEVSIRESDHGTVLFSVKDNGPGIPTDVMPRIFEPFFTTRKGGTGLGLSIVRHIVESHGGRISAANNEGCTGSTFEVRLPVVKTESA